MAGGSGSRKRVAHTVATTAANTILGEFVPTPVETTARFSQEAAAVVDELCRLPVLTTDVEMVRRAIDTSRRYRIAVWDALIIEAARTAGCDRVLSEDLQAGQAFDGITIENPFAR
jgi:predicted nucleic acid-binding protein